MLDANYVFLQWPHSLLFTAALAVLLAHIVPFTVLLLVSPTLQRYSHHKPLRWVNKLKPLLDAYQGPYNNKVRYWTGLLLLVRCIILAATAFNITGNQALNLFMITIITTTILICTWVKLDKLYKNQFPHLLEVFFIGNLQFFSLAKLFLSSYKESNVSAEENLTYCMVGSTVSVFTLIIAYHNYKLCLGTKIGKSTHEKLVTSLRRPKRKLQTDTIEGNDWMTPSSSPTTTIVELKEPLLEDESTNI